MHLYSFTYVDSSLLNDEALNDAIKFHLNFEATLQRWKSGYTYFIDSVLTEGPIGKVTYFIYVEGEYEEV